jgi:hypothetical protein
MGFLYVGRAGLAVGLASEVGGFGGGGFVAFVVHG